MFGYNKGSLQELAQISLMLKDELNEVSNLGEKENQRVEEI